MNTLDQWKTKLKIILNWLDQFSILNQKTWFNFKKLEDGSWKIIF